MPVLKTIIASTRPGRVGLPIGQWFYRVALSHGAFSHELIDLAEVGLPFLDEPNHPRLRQYTREHTRRWSARIEEADAFVFVTPEYNYGYPATLKNAIDYLHHEWQFKPVGFVSYGGIAGGTRSVQQLKQVVTALNMVPLVEGVNIANFNQYFDAEREFQPTEGQVKAAQTMLGALLRWSQALSSLRSRP